MTTWLRENALVGSLTFASLGLGIMPGPTDYSEWFAGFLLGVALTVNYYRTREQPERKPT